MGPDGVQAPGQLFLKASSTLVFPVLGCSDLPQILSSPNKSPFLPRLVQVQFPSVATKRFLTSLERSLPPQARLPASPAPSPGHDASGDLVSCSFQTHHPPPPDPIDCLHFLHCTGPSACSSISSPPHPSTSHPKPPLSSPDLKSSLPLSLSHHTG